MFQPEINARKPVVLASSKGGASGFRGYDNSG